MGTSAIAHSGHFPLPGDRTPGCIGHQYASGRSVSRTISTTRPDVSLKRARSSLTRNGVDGERGDYRSWIVGGEGDVIERRIRKRARDGGIGE